MGKSNKKFKAERINAIRKQYDSFIEEDKKRKDRNEYILERLDKIRTGSAIVPVRNAPKDYYAAVNQSQFTYDRKDYMERLIPTYEKSQYEYCIKPANHSNAVASINEQMLKEISKRYILIPRHTSTFEFNKKCIIKSNDDNGDWRHKYKILEELKQKEKEDKQSPNSDLCLDLATMNINDQTNKEEPNIQTQILLSEYNKHSSDIIQDNFETNPSFDKVDTNTEMNRQPPKPEIEKNITNNSEYNTDFNKPVSDNDTENLTEYTDIEKQPMATETTPQASPIQDKNENAIDELVNERQDSDTDLSPNELTQNEKIQAEHGMESKPTEDIQLEKVQYSNINPESENLTETSQPENYQEDKGENKIYDENINKCDPETQRDNNIFYESSLEDNLRTSDVKEPVENINFIVPNIDQEANIKNEIVENKIESLNVLPTVYPDEQGVENTEHADQINEFEAEQTEMFYSDPNVTDYAYDQTGSANIDHANTEGYTQDENYAYYESNKQQVYSGDHVESTEQYDPNYESQYGNYDGADQILDQQYDRYEAEEILTEPQIYEQVQFEEPDYNVVKEVEGELDAEQNYNIAPDSQDDNINIVKETVLPQGDPIGENPPPTTVS